MTRERDEAVESAPGTAEPREPTGWPPTPKKIAKLLLDKAWQPLTVAQRRRLCPECFQVVAHDLVEHSRPGLARRVGCGRAGHTRPRAEPVPRGPTPRNR